MERLINRFDEKMQAEIWLEELGFKYDLKDSLPVENNSKAYKQVYKAIDRAVKYNIVAITKHLNIEEKPISIEFVAELKQPESNKIFTLTFANYDYEDMLRVIDGLIDSGFAKYLEREAE